MKVEFEAETFIGTSIQPRDRIEVELLLQDPDTNKALLMWIGEPDECSAIFLGERIGQTKYKRIVDPNRAFVNISNERADKILRSL